MEFHGFVFGWVECGRIVRNFRRSTDGGFGGVAAQSLISSCPQF
jgi:hypothetical protein